MDDLAGSKLSLSDGSDGKLAQAAATIGAGRDGGQSGAANGSHHSVSEIVEHREESTDSVRH